MSFTKLEDFTGRYGINIGQSIINAWNERNNIPTQRAENGTYPEFHLTRYSSKPDSVDGEAPRKFRPESSKARTPTQYKGSETKGELRRSGAVEQPSQDWECVLLWDPETHTFTLEKVTSTRNVPFERPNSVLTSVSGSSFNVNNRSEKTRVTDRKGKGKAHPVDNGLDKFQEPRELEDGEIDELADALMKESRVEWETKNVEFRGSSIRLSSRREEEVDVVKKRRPPYAPVQLPKPKAPAETYPKTSEAPKPSPKPKPKAKPKARTTAPVISTSLQTEKMQQEDVTAEHPEEEELTFGQRSLAVVRPNPHPKPHPFTHSGLALPRLPSPTPTHRAHHAQPTASQVLQPPITSQCEVMQEDDGLEDVDEDIFANEIEMVLEDNDEEEDEELESVSVSVENGIPTTTGRPLSLTELAGGNNFTGTVIDSSDDDDDTSSESSED
ncbi:hypothetical protein Clacol_005864 [Clathrus columnatus]|uniref:Transcription elongation factor Eaf N-terminal domain-containing protein n=1 Tax=Clathrus columnatus TaxID=1419009 RepID=A0AAV5ADQ2_9AGAM|nr:hypothetical protein Clacol_005864 [Clathrus columnatus]